MKEYINKIEEVWQIRNELSENNFKLKEAHELTSDIINELNEGNLRVCEKKDNRWVINEWVKKAILLHFQITESQVYDGNCIRWYDKIAPKYNNNFPKEEFKKDGVRIVPGAFIRTGAYLAPKVIAMPSFINIGAYIGEGTMVDSFATIGSCAQIGKQCHISGGAGIGGVLEPLGARPVIIEDGCFIGARSEIVEGVIIEEGAVISMGVFIGASTKIVDRYTGEIIYGKVPAYCVVVPGTLPAKEAHLPSLFCAVIIKKVDKATRSKTSINDLLR